MTTLTQRYVWAIFLLTCYSLLQGLTTAALAQTDGSLNDNQALLEWRQWRGPLGTGASPHGNPPTHWSENHNIGWKTSIPGLGHSTPIIVGQRIFLTAALPYGKTLPPKFSGASGAHDNLPITQRYKFLAILVDRATGKILWTKELTNRLPHEGGHYTASLASASPISDGSQFFAYFGSYGLYCLDEDGNVRWEKQLGTMKTKHGHGEGSSPALYRNRIAINWDHEEASFLVVLDTHTGEEVWRAARDEVTSWSSPIITNVGEKAQVIVAGTTRVRGYHLETGEVVWECGGLSANVVATPVAGEGMAVVGSSYDTRAMLGIRLSNSSGDITDSEHVAWKRRLGTPYVPSPLLYQDTVYFLNHFQGILSQVNIQTGEETNDPLRLSHIRNVYASPVAANGKIYVSDLRGVTMVVGHDVPRTLATNRLDDEIAASLAIAGDEIYVRGKTHLYRISK